VNLNELIGQTASLSALEHLEDTRAEHDLDTVLSLAASIAGCSLALLSFMDEQREWFKAKIGFDSSELSLDNSFCAHVVSGGEPLIVSDTVADQRFLQKSTRSKSTSHSLLCRFSHHHCRRTRRRCFGGL
jgi:hypothetical protein